MRIGVGSNGRRAGREALTAIAISLLVLVSAGAGGAAPEAFSAAEIYRNAAPSVVLIFGFEDSGNGSSGTGSIVSPDGLVLTNDHVISRGDSGRLYSNLVVYFKPQPISGDNRKDLETAYLVDVIARDPKMDLALLRVKGAPAGLKPIVIGNSEEVDIGESVAAIGHPGGGGLWTLTTGTVSSKRRDRDRDIFQTDTAINPGNSGGPLLDANARLIGINTFVRRVNEEGLPLEGLNYSLRGTVAVDWMNRQRGIGPIAMVSRGRHVEVSAVPLPPTPPPTPPPDAARSEPLLPPMRDTANAPPTPAPAPVRTESAHETAPAPEPGFREFEGRDGEKLYGVPNPEIERDDRLKYARQGFQEVNDRANASIDEMDRLMNDYDNF